MRRKIRKKERKILPKFNDPISDTSKRKKRTPNFKEKKKFVLFSRDFFSLFKEMEFHKDA